MVMQLWRSPDISTASSVGPELAVDQKNEEGEKYQLVTDGHSAPNSPKAYSVKQTRAFQRFPFASRYKVKVCQWTAQEEGFWRSVCLFPAPSPSLPTHPLPPPKVLQWNASSETPPCDQLSLSPQTAHFWQVPPALHHSNFSATQ